MIRKILKWTGITLLTVILVVIVLIAVRQNLTFDAPYPDVRSSTDSAVIARGKEISIWPRTLRRLPLQRQCRFGV